MQFPESWLREFCNPSLTTQELADTLTMAGLEVEELQPVAPPPNQNLPRGEERPEMRGRHRRGAGGEGGAVSVN